MKGSKGKDSHSTVTSLRFSVFIGFVLIAGACQHPVKDKLPVDHSFGKIIYDTYLTNRDSTDSWEDECLAGFNRKGLIDHLFDEVYKGKIVPTEYFSGETILLDQLKKMEKDGEFSRKNISKIQFEEHWMWNDEKAEMQKQLLSMTIAYEVFDHAGKSRGQKPIFKLIFRRN